ncbi:MAG: hypothetical protein ACE5IP_05495 [Terriglobia bacterium]
MIRREMARMSWVVLLLVIPAVLAVAQEGGGGQFRQNVRILPTPGCPLEITEATATFTEGEVRGFSATLRNYSDQRVVAYAVLWKAKLLGGAKLESVVTRDYLSPSKAPETAGIAAGAVETVTSTEHLKPPLLVSLAVVLDYVELADGTHYGKDETETWKELQTSREAVEGYRAILLHLYERQGVEALLEELRPK